MTKEIKVKDQEGKEEALNLKEEDYALVRAIQDLTRAIERMFYK